MANRTVTFLFDDDDLIEIARLEAEGFRFATITMRDPRGYERDLKVWMPGDPRPSAFGGVLSENCPKCGQLMFNNPPYRTRCRHCGHEWTLGCKGVAG